MCLNIRFILLILSIIVTIILSIYDIILFKRYAKRGKYYYESIGNETYVVIKEGYLFIDCSINATTFRAGEIDWLVIRNKRHYVFLFCFWVAILLAFVNSILG